MNLINMFIEKKTSKIKTSKTKSFKDQKQKNKMLIYLFFCLN